MFSAVWTFQNAMADNPQRPEAVNNMGMTFLRTGDYEKAANSFIRAAMLQPQLPDPNQGVGVADVLRGVDAWLGSAYPFEVPTCTT